MTRSVSSPARRVGPILLVDDYEDARLSVREALEDNGYTVIEAADGKQALHLLVSEPNTQVGLILLDLQMPIMTGWQLLDLLRCYVKLASIPVIIVTAQDPKLDDLQHRRVFGCLRAPYELADLVEMVDACFSGNRTPFAVGDKSDKHTG